MTLNLLKQKIVRTFRRKGIEKYLPELQSLFYMNSNSMDSYMLYDQIIKKSHFRNINQNKNSIMLDVGCGIASFLIGSEHRKAIGIDYNKNKINLGKELSNRYEKKNIDLMVGSGLTLPLKNNSVDTIFCSHLLEHLINPNIMVEEFKRVLKPDGVIYIIVPNRNTIDKIIRRNLNMTWKADPEHVKEYTLPELKKLFNNEKWTIKKLYSDYFILPFMKHPLNLTLFEILPELGLKIRKLDVFFPYYSEQHIIIASKNSEKQCS